jgi:hypothetical protein
VTAEDLDPIPGNNTATESTTIDATGPTILGVDLLAGPVATPVPDCGQVRATGSHLQLTFDEAMFDPSGNTTAGDVTNPASYLLIEAGLDRDLDSDGCDVLGDDLVEPITSVSYSAAGPSATLQLGGPLRDGLFRVATCGLEDLVGNTQDVDPFTRQFRLDRANLFANAHFDCELPPWVEDPVGEISHSPIDFDDAAASGSVRLANTAGSTNLIVGQCASVSAGADVTVSTKVRAALAPGASATVFANCLYFVSVDCTGTGLGGSTVSQGVNDTAFEWAPVTFGFNPVFSPGNEPNSALCSLRLQIPAGQFAEVFLDQLRLGDPNVFADGFETGDTSVWSATVP